MGLLDSLTYGNQGGYGGLLDFLRTQEQYQPSAGFSANQPTLTDTERQMMTMTGPNQPLSGFIPPQAAPAAPAPQIQPQPQQPERATPVGIGSYQMPRFGSMAQFTPDPAAIPQNAQPAQGQMPSMTPQFGNPNEGNITTGLRALGNPGGAINKIADAVQGFSTGQAPSQRAQSQLFEAYKGAGLTPQQAYLAVLNPHLASNLMGGGSTDDIKEFQFAKKEDPTLTFAKFMQQKKAVSGEYSLTPQYGTDDKGNTVLIQTGKSGEAIQTKLPAGVKISSGVEKIDLGTSWGLVDKRTGNMIGQQAKDVSGKASQEAQGEAQGKAIVALPTVVNTTEQSIKLVDEMIKHPGRETATGLSGTLDPRNYLGGTDAKDFIVRAKQIEGRTFLSAFDQLRGAGAITEAEGGKATAALARLDRSQSDTEYLAALNELKGVLAKGLEIARQRAGQSGHAAPAASPNVDALLKKYGG